MRFFFAGNAANGDDKNLDDYIYTNSATTESATSNVTVVLADPQLAGQTLNAGAVQRVNWNLTGLSNIEFIEARYSTDDGATFPITHLAHTTQNANSTGFDWTVPNVNSSTVRLRVQVSTKTGTAVTTLSGRFAIQSSGNPPPPGRAMITSAEVTGKKLRVYGVNFPEGAVVFMNGEKQKTAPGEPPTEALVCKKAGKWITPGTTVSLTIKLADGSFSEEYFYTRPQE